MDTQTQTQTQIQIQALANAVTRNANFIASELSGLAYGIGYFVALGMNWADKDTSGIGALLISLLSWANVGFLLMAHRA